MDIVIKEFNELDIDELYNILRLRNQVFIVEQNCPYLDIDNMDKNAIHIYYKENNNIIAYLRIILIDNNIYIGRIIVDKIYRGKGLAKDLIGKSIKYIFNNYKTNIIFIEAQSRLEDFYSAIGFKRESDDYILDDIPHCKMSIVNIN